MPAGAQPGTVTASAVVIARNEAPDIASTIGALVSTEGVRTVIVVDGGSTDGTVEEAERAGATVLVVGADGGKGGALEAAFDQLPPDEVLLLVDGDVGGTAREAVTLLVPVCDGTADLAIGVLPRQVGGGFGIVKRLSAALISRAGFGAEEPLSGQRAARRSVLDTCRPFARGFGLETAMTLDAVRLGFRVVEVPVDMRHRPTGRGVAGFVHRGRQGIDIVRAAAPRLSGLR